MRMMNYQNINLFTLLTFFSATLSAMDAPDLGEQLRQAVKADNLERARVLIAR